MTSISELLTRVKQQETTQVPMETEVSCSTSFLKYQWHKHRAIVFVHVVSS